MRTANMPTKLVVSTVSRPKEPNILKPHGCWCCYPVLCMWERRTIELAFGMEGLHVCRCFIYGCLEIHESFLSLG